MRTNDNLRTNDLIKRAEKGLQKTIDTYIMCYGSEDIYSREISPILDSYLEYCGILDEIENIVSGEKNKQNKLSQEILDKITYARQTGSTESKTEAMFHFGMVRELITGLAVYHAKVKGF